MTLFWLPMLLSVITLELAHWLLVNPEGDQEDG